MSAYATSTAQIAAALSDLAGRFADLPDTEIPQVSVQVDLQFCSWKGDNEPERIAAVNHLNQAILNVAAGPKSETMIGSPIQGVDLEHVNVDIWTCVESTKERKLRQENDELRAQVAKLLAP